MDPVAPYTICPLTPVTPETCIGFMYSRDSQKKPSLSVKSLR